MANEFRFGKIPRHVKVAAKRAFAGSNIGQLTRTVRRAREQYGRLQTHVPGARELTAAYRRGGVGGFVRAVSGPSYQSTWTAIESYARGDAGRQAVTDLLRELGPVGSILGAIVGHDTGSRKATLPQDLRYALDLVGAFADQPSVINALQRILEGRGAQVSWPSQSGSTPGSVPSTHPGGNIAGQIAAAIQAAQEPEEPGASIEPRRLGSPGRGSEPVTVDVGNGSKRLPPDHPLISGQMVETPESTNVYAFGYDIQTHSLFIRFKAGIHEGGGGYGKGGGGRFGAGTDERGKPHRPGALYIYHNVPPELFLTLMDAPSKGNWLWDNIRIRGTHSGHRYDYALAGVQGGYVPRKATLTPEGEVFTPRTVFTDQGRRLTSALPELLVRPLMPMGRPPNDGRHGFRRQ